MKTNHVPLFIRLILILGLAFAASSCETRGQRRAAVAGGIIGGTAVGAATGSWVGAAAGAAGGALIGSRVNERRAYLGKRRIFH